LTGLFCPPLKQIDGEEPRAAGDEDASIVGHVRTHYFLWRFRLSFVEPAGSAGSIRVPRYGNEGHVLLAAALVHQEVIISATSSAWIFAAGGGAGVINRAAAFFGVEELADAAEVFVALAAHDGFVAVGFARVALGRGFDRHLEVLGEALHVALIERDDRIRAAVARAVQTIVLGHLASVWSIYNTRHHTGGRGLSP
jgi:hypothetical protein